MAKEKNDEYSMARNQLRTAMTAIKRLMKHVEGEGELKAWVQSKLTKAADYMDSVADYMDSNDKVVKEARELSSDIYTILEAKNPPRVSAKEQSRRNLSEVLSFNQNHHEALASEYEDDRDRDYFKKRSQKVDRVASHVIKALKHHSAHDIHEMLSSHSGNDIILHGGPRHPMHTTMVRQARSMMHDKLKKEGLHEIAKQYAPEKPGILRRIGQKFGLSEGYSVGEMGTDELVNRYKAMTPGQEKDKKTIETIKRVVESRRYGVKIPPSEKFPGGVVGPNSKHRKRLRRRRLGRDPGPRFGPGHLRRQLVGKNPGKRRTIRLHIG